MLLFIERTWAVWWFLAVLATLRWFYFSATDSLAPDLLEASDERDSPETRVPVIEEVPLSRTLFLASTRAALRDGWDYRDILCENGTNQLNDSSNFSFTSKRG